MRSLRLSAAGLAFLVISVGAGAPPARAARLEFGPAKVGRYLLSGSGDEANGLSLLLARRTRHSYQTLEYDRDFESVGLTIQAGFCSGRLVADLGRHGTIDLTFAARLGAAVACRDPARLPLSFSHRATATGLLRLATNTHHFGTITLHRLRARLVEPGPRPLSPVTAQVAHGTSLSGERGDATFQAFLPRHGLVDEDVVLNQAAGPSLFITSEIHEWDLPRDLFVVDPRLAEAQVRWAGPWLGGTTIFRARRPRAVDGRGGLFGRLIVRSDGAGRRLLVRPGHPGVAQLGRG